MDNFPAFKKIYHNLIKIFTNSDTYKEIFYYLLRVAGFLVFSRLIIFILSQENILSFIDKFNNSFVYPDDAFINFGLRILFIYLFFIYLTAKFFGLFKKINNLNFFLGLIIIVFVDILRCHFLEINVQLNPSFKISYTGLSGYSFFLTFLFLIYKFFDFPAKIFPYNKIFKLKKNNLFKKTKKYKSVKFFLIAMIIIQTLLLFIAIYFQYSVSVKNYHYFLAVVFGYILCFILFYAIRKEELKEENNEEDRQKTGNFIISASLIFIFSIVGFIFEFIYFKEDSFGPCAHGYCDFLDKTIIYNKECVVSHFPRQLPLKASLNYKSLTQWINNGPLLVSVKFNTEAKYIDMIINYNKENTEVIIPLDRFNSDIDFKKYFNLKKEKENYLIYIMKNACIKENYNDYTSGFIVSKDKKEVTLFYIDDKINY